MPALPEVGDRTGLIRRSEVLREHESEHQSDAAGHVAVAREVEVDLQAIPRGRYPGLAHGESIAELKQGIHHGRQAIGDHGLFAQSRHKQEQAFGHAFRIEANALPELRHDVGIMQDRAGNQMREKRNGKRKTAKIEIVDPAFGTID
nr:hypothetical protein [Methylomonas koyamae]